MTNKPTISEAVRIDDASFTYAGSGVAALREVNLKQNAGEMIGIMGASGAGKSTLAKDRKSVV